MNKEKFSKFLDFLRGWADELTLGVLAFGEVKEEKFPQLEKLNSQMSDFTIEEMFEEDNIKNQQSQTSKTHQENSNPSKIQPTDKQHNIQSSDIKQPISRGNNIVSSKAFGKVTAPFFWNIDNQDKADKLKETTGTLKQDKADKLKETTGTLKQDKAVLAEPNRNKNNLLDIEFQEESRKNDEIQNKALGKIEKKLDYFEQKIFHKQGGAKREQPQQTIEVEPSDNTSLIKSLLASIKDKASGDAEGLGKLIGVAIGAGGLAFNKIKEYFSDGKTEASLTNFSKDEIENDLNIANSSNTTKEAIAEIQQKYNQAYTEIDVEEDKRSVLDRILLKEKQIGLSKETIEKLDKMNRFELQALFDKIADNQNIPDVEKQMVYDALQKALITSPTNQNISAGALKDDISDSKADAIENLEKKITTLDTDVSLVDANLLKPSRLDIEKLGDKIPSNNKSPNLQSQNAQSSNLQSQNQEAVSDIKTKTISNAAQSSSSNNINIETTNEHLNVDNREIPIVNGKVNGEAKLPSFPINQSKLGVGSSSSINAEADNQNANISHSNPNVGSSNDTSIQSSNAESSDVISDGQASAEPKDTEIQEVHSTLTPNKNHIIDNFSLSQTSQDFIEKTTSVPKPKIVNNEKVIYEKSKSNSKPKDPFDAFESGGVSDDIARFFNAK